VLTPARRRGVEILDDPGVDPAVRNRSIDDVTRSNRLLGGLRSAGNAFARQLGRLPRDVTLLDVGTGLADIPARAIRIAASRGTNVFAIGVDEAASLLIAAHDRLSAGVCADALALPFRDHSVDVVMCSQVLHHFEDPDAVRLLREMNRVARRVVIVSDLRRSWIAAAGFWLVSFPLRFHPVTRHDGVVSVLRGFTRDDLRRLVRTAIGIEPRVTRGLGWRLVVEWESQAA
jgi:SAM-dependent methyltransferase